MNRLLKKNEKYLLACSFGPDSMALFHMLKTGGYDFDAAIVNYHLRNESDSEVDGLYSYCRANNVHLFIKEVNEIKGNIEASCREIRYNFFKDLMDENKYSALLVAHHLDDHLETYLLQKERKNRPLYYGINEISVIKGMKVIRPLLGYTKDELLNYNKKNNVPYAIDKTNLENHYSRNVIRHEKIERMSISEKHELASQIDRENETLTKEISSIEIEKLHDKKYLLSLSKIQLLYGLNKLKDLCGLTEGLSEKQCSEIIKILNSKKANIHAKIRSNLYFFKEYDICCFSKTCENKTYEYTLPRPGKLDTDEFFLDFTNGGQDRNIKHDDYPLTIRNINKNDEYLINDYIVKANRLLVDWKVPLSIRNSWPVIVNSKGTIIYIPRYKKDFYVTDELNFFVKIKNL